MSNKKTLAPLKEKIGAMPGIWALYFRGYYNYPTLLQFSENGTVSIKTMDASSNIDWAKRWVVSEAYLYLLDENRKVCMVFEYWRPEATTPVLVGRERGKTEDYLLRRCGAAHIMTPFALDFPDQKDVDFLKMLASGNDFGMQMRPQEDITVPLEADLCVNKTPYDIPNMRPQTYTATPTYLHVLNNAKLVSGFLIETADGECLTESSYVADINTSRCYVNCYLDMKAKTEYHANVKPVVTIKGMAFYLDNGTGYGHWFWQSMPCLYFLDWLEENGVNLENVKILVRSSIHIGYIKETLKAYGLLDKLSLLSFVDTSTLPAMVEIEKLFFPSLMWMPRREFLPTGYKSTEFSVSPTYKHVVGKLKKGFLTAALQAKYADKPYIFFLREKEVRRERLLNQKELSEALKTLGFHCIDTAELSLPEKANMMHRARLVVSTQGGGLAATVFCQPGTYILELFNHAVLHEQHGNAAGVFRLKYACMVYPAVDLKNDHEHFAVDRCFYVNIPEVIATAKRIISGIEDTDKKSGYTNAA